MVFTIALDIYEGPLELLYHLIRKQKLSISEVSLLKIANQFLNTIELMKQIDLDIAADFLYISAILIDLKARELLPPVEIEEVEEESEIKNLLIQLEEFKKFKTAAVFLKQKEEFQSHVWFHEENSEQIQEEIEFQPSLYDLLMAIQNILDRVKEEPIIPILQPENISIVDRMNELIKVLAKKPIIEFSLFFENDVTKTGIILTFLALLELIRLQLVRFYQKEVFGEIVVHKKFGDELPLISHEGTEPLLIIADKKD